MKQDQPYNQEHDRNYSNRDSRLRNEGMVLLEFRKSFLEGPLSLVKSRGYGLSPGCFECACSIGRLLRTAGCVTARSGQRSVHDHCGAHWRTYIRSWRPNGGRIAQARQPLCRRPYEPPESRVLGSTCRERGHGAKLNPGEILESPRDLFGQNDLSWLGKAQ